jgi:hypothetical protein
MDDRQHGSERRLPLQSAHGGGLGGICELGGVHTVLCSTVAILRHGRLSPYVRESALH